MMKLQEGADAKECWRSPYSKKKDGRNYSMHGFKSQTRTYMKRKTGNGTLHYVKMRSVEKRQGMVMVGCGRIAGPHCDAEE